MRFEIEDNGNIHLYLSRRNLLALLTKLDMEGSARTITNDYPRPYAVTSESDEIHYAHPTRVGYPAGRMHPQTEEDIANYAD